MRKIQEIVVKLSYIGFTRTCGEVVVSEFHVIPSPVNLIDIFEFEFDWVPC